MANGVPGLEIVAITQMEGEKATSWDMQGALLRRTFGIRTVDQNMLKEIRPIPTGSISRYLLLRTPGPQSIPPEFVSVAGGCPVVGYSGLPDGTMPTVMGFPDALGGAYWILRLDASAGATKANLQAQVPGKDWELYASESFVNGLRQVDPTSVPKIQISKGIDGLSSQISFVVPKGFSEREASVLVLGSRPSYVTLHHLSGPVSMGQLQKPEDITHVEIRSRAQDLVTLDGIPLQPDPKATYEPHHFLPKEIISADHGVAHLPGGEFAEIKVVSNLHAKPNSIRKLVLQVDHATLSNDLDFMESLYDEEGWPLLQDQTKVRVSGGYVEEYMGDIPPFMHRQDLSAKIGIGNPRTQFILNKDSKGTTWSFPHGVIHIKVPREIAEKVFSVDGQIIARDKRGQVVSKEGYVSGPTEDTIQFKLSPAASSKVATVTLRGRPYVWVRFPNVSLDLKQE